VKIGLITESNLNANYRTFIPMRALAKRGHTIVWPSPTGQDAPMRELLGCDLVHCYRRTDRLADLQRLSQRGVAICFDNDDDFSSADMGDDGRSAKALRHNKQLSRDMLKAARIADVTTTPSEALAERYRAAGVDRVVVLENHLPREAFGFASKAKHEGIVVGWVAGREHRIDLERLPIASAFRDLLKVHDELRILTVGLRLPLSSDRYQHMVGVEFRDLLTVTARMDLGVAALADTSFNRARSNVKLKEYSSGNTPWLASPVGPYRALGEDQGGCLVADGDWKQALDELIRNPRRRKRLAKRGLRWAKTQTIDRHIDAWERAFLQAAGHSADTLHRYPVPAAR
jgi:glycosyltransferase involved in cell wall biosynthesis